MEETPQTPAQPIALVFPRAHRLMRGLTWLYASVTMLLWIWLTLGLGTRGPAMARDWLDGGFGAIALSTVFFAVTASLATFALTYARFWHTAPPEAESAGPKITPGFAARQAQAIVYTGGAFVVWCAIWWLWPEQDPQAVETTSGVGAASFVATFALAFASLVAERLVAAFPEPQLPEAPTLRRLLRFCTLELVAGACLEIGHGMGWAWVHWPMIALSLLPGIVVIELMLRALGRLFLPPPSPEAATAVTESLLATIFTGGPRSPGDIFRTQFGLDFSRSWALQFLSKALLPALFGTALLCWGLSGVKLIDLGQRGVYERFGAPVAVFQPGLHLLLPWPLGRLRLVDFGTIHSVAIGVDQAEPDKAMSADAEAEAPLSLNRLWETSHPGQAYYLVPSTGTGPQGFQSIATEISVLYRVGSTDSAALQSVYTIAEPETLVRDEASRLVLRFFNSRTLETVIGARRESVAGALRDQLAAQVDSWHAGIEIVSVLIEEIHPPGGAASAYHAVQAAEINATATIFREQARKEITDGEAQQQAHQMTTASDAKAAEILRTADAAAYRFGAEQRAYAAGGKAFLLERYFGNLDKALSTIPVTILDHRLSAEDGPILDLRGTAGSAGAKPAAPAPIIPGIVPGAR